MTYQEQRVLTFNILTIMTFLVVSYIVIITMGLVVIAGDIPKEVGLDKTYQPTKVLLGDEHIPIVVKREPEIDDETYLLAQIINAEAGNQPYRGKIAVGNVVMNRVESPKYPDTIKEVVYQKGQFSPVSDGSINNQPSEESIQAAKDVLNGDRVVHKGVLFFYNPDISTSNWIFTRRTVTKIGEHVFAS